MSLLRIETEHVVISWKEGIYKVVIGDQKTSREVNAHMHANDYTVEPLIYQKLKGCPAGLGTGVHDCS